MRKWFRRERDETAEPFDHWRIVVHLSNGQTWTVEGAALDRYDSSTGQLHSTPNDLAETERLVDGIAGGLRDGIAGGLRDAGFEVDVETERRFVSPR